MSLATLPCRPRSRNKIKPIGHATAYKTLIISCKSNGSLSFIWQKNWRKRLKQLKILKIGHLQLPPAETIIDQHWGYAACKKTYNFLWVMLILISHTQKIFHRRRPCITLTSFLDQSLVRWKYTSWHLY